MIERRNPLWAATQGPRRGARKTSRSQEIETRSFHEKAVNHDRTGTPVVCRDASHAQVQDKHVPLMKPRTSTLETKHIMIERGNPLSAVTQVTSQVTSNQC